MNTNYQNDLKLLKKAKRRIMTASILVYIMICLFFFAAYFILNQSFLPQSDFLDQTYITAVVVSAVAWLIVLFVIDSGKPAARYVYYAMTGVQTLFSFWLIWRVYSDPAAWIVWLIWAVLMLAESYFLFRYGHWMFTSYYGRIFFEKTLMVYEQEPAYGRDEYTPPLNDQTRVFEAPSGPGQHLDGGSRVPDYSTAPARQAEYSSSFPNAHERMEAEAGYSSSSGGIRDKLASHPWVAGIFSTKHKPLTHPRAAIRLGFTVYAELILFPILMEVFGFLFKSANGKYTFATSIMFTMCVISAVIWTVPIFFLYLKQNGFKALIVTGLGCEVVSTLFYFFVLRRYYLQPADDHVYRLSVFLWFALFDAVRYLILIWAVIPILKLPRIERESGTYTDTALFSNLSLNDLKESLPKPAEIASKARQACQSAKASLTGGSSIGLEEKDPESSKDLPAVEKAPAAKTREDVRTRMVSEEIENSQDAEGRNSESGSFADSVTSPASQSDINKTDRTKGASSSRRPFPSRADRTRSQSTTSGPAAGDRKDDPVILLPGDDGFEDLK